MLQSTSACWWAGLSAGLLLGCGNTETRAAAAAANDAGAPAQEPGAAGAGGAPSGAALSVASVLARPAGDCTLKSQPGATLLARGTFDRLFASDYTAGLLAYDGLADRVALSGVEVQLSDAASQSLSKPYSTTATGFVDAASAGVVMATIIPASIAASLPVGEVIARVRVSGKTLASGRVLVSPELTFPIDVCDGCLVQYPESARDPQAPGTAYQCRVAAASDPDPAPQPCQLGIDEPFSCTLCAATTFACTSPANNPSH